MAIKIHMLLLSFTILRHGRLVLIIDLRRSAPQSEPDWEYMFYAAYMTCCIYRILQAAEKDKLFTSTLL